MVLFSNTIPSDQALKVLDRFVHYGQRTLIAIVKNVFANMKVNLLRLRDTFELN